MGADTAFSPWNMVMLKTPAQIAIEVLAEEIIAPSLAYASTGRRRCGDPASASMRKFASDPAGRRLGQTLKGVAEQP
ncbi:hypothetical protein [Bradyrhizobium sp. AC87j1]|uniref:hypothetical protein n=1 Tax=Bradyrhizobium sp. AC87j1 TaxID=2055894 RepID=UPI0011AFF76D|nr:hypothetical protein [Bradyrhizobium sp. AC87j1]